MDMAASHGNARARNIALVLALVWTLVSIGGGYLLLRQSFMRAFQENFGQRAERISRTMAERISADPAASKPDLMGLNVIGQFEDIRRLNPDIRYAMLWSPNGRVAGHTEYAEVDKRLGPGEYPQLERQELRRYVNRGGVLEVTVPLTFAEGAVPAGFVSLGYPLSRIEDDFWSTQRSLLIGVGIVGAIGVVLIFIGLQLTLRAMERARQELETNARARTSLLTERGMLASVLAHEVRSPLTALRFNLHSLRNYVLTETATEKQLELTERCEREIRRLDLMLTDFLTRTQIIAPIVPTSINQVIKEALDFLRPALDQKNIRVVTHLDPANPMVSVNPDELRQVLLNLSANAQEAMAKGGSLSVSTLLDRSGQEPRVTMLFRDSGVGIPPELHTRIFEPFFTTKPTGSGLGLALVRRVISGAGGTIFCESAVGEGTTFRIVLPPATDEPASLTHAAEEPDDLVIDHTAAEKE
jgi:signal transduction histidine kinase